MIPKCISDISHDWITDLMKKLHPQLAEESLALTSISLNTSTCNEELFECCRLSFAFENQTRPGKHHWMVKLMPTDPDLRQIVLRHDLFKKEMLLHQIVIPQLQAFVESKKVVSGGVGFSAPLPKLLHGQYDEENGLGVLVFADLQSLNYELADPDLKRISLQSRIEAAISTLASFHAICNAFEFSHGSQKIDQIFPFLNANNEGSGNIWFHADMQVYVDEMYETCLQFLKSIPGQEETSAWFEQRMKNPEALQNSDQHLKTLVHGDLWHNNIYFKRQKEEDSSQESVLFGSWQMCHYGSAATDLCFFLCSSTTTNFRRENWDRVIRLYFDQFTKSFQNLLESSISTTSIPLPTFEEFLTDVRSSIPISIFFCANFRDLDQSMASSSIASDMERCYAGQADQGSIQDLQGSFCKLQNSYSVYMMRDMSMTAIREDTDDDDDDDDDEDDEDDDDEEGGIIISFGSKAEAKPIDIASPKVSRRPEGPVLMERKPVTKVPTVASEKELEDILEARSSELMQKKRALDPRKARALRRKLYLDLYGEVVQRMLI